MSWIQKIRDAIDYIEANLSGDITADTVGRAISYSPSSFQNIFSAVTGYSIGEYVRFRRLSLAADEICEGLSVTDAAFRYGYENAESFSRAFKRLFGYPPSSVSGSVKRLRFSPISISYNILDRQYAVSFLYDNGRDDLAQLYEKIAELSKGLGQIIPPDFSAYDMFSDRDKLKPFCDTLLEICALEEEVLDIIGN